MAKGEVFHGTAPYASPRSGSRQVISVCIILAGAQDACLILVVTSRVTSLGTFKEAKVEDNVYVVLHAFTYLFEGGLL